MVMSKRRRSPDRTKSGVDLREMLNAKRNQDRDLRVKLNDWATLTNKVIPTNLVVCTTRNEQKEPVSWYETQYSREIEGLDPLEKFMPPSLEDLRLKWFDKLPVGSIENFHQLTKSFIARFVINTKAPKGVGLHVPGRDVHPVGGQHQASGESYKDTYLGGGTVQKVKEKLVDNEITQAEKAKVRLNLRFDRGDDDTNLTANEEEDLPLDTIHMIGGSNHPNLENRIWGEI
ncbi:hypothetical protein Acr_00g0082450 [Actinidia rufa]|uniref:Uncharacterized protein n=1 Tax=Actinidia rufa TaxID=165716 RepID=A0A7J0DUZ6_9ERIC|nr:hypothetical protein Acr_00g0082450 [Actinidia rufa]